MPFSGSGKAVIYDGFHKNSTLVKVRVQDINVGDVVYLYDEDSLTEIGSTVSTSDDIEIVVTALAAGRIIAFVDEPGLNTAGGVYVLDYVDGLTGWLVPVPVDEESVPEDIGLFSPGVESPVTARYDPNSVNSVPIAYRAAAIDLIAEPMIFDLRVEYKIDPILEDPKAVVSIGAVRNARGAWTAVIQGTTTNSKDIYTDATFNVVVTDSEARTATRSVTVAPVSGYVPAIPAAPVSTIEQFWFNSFFTTFAGYILQSFIRPEALCELSIDGGSTWGPVETKSNLAPGSYNVMVRLASDHADFISRTIPVPYS